MGIKKITFNKKYRNKALALLLTASMTGTLTGCEATEMAGKNNFDTIDTNTDSESLENGYTQIQEVKGEGFGLSINYKCDLEENEKWTITGDKTLIMTIKTEDLPEGYKVYIDNIHTDTSLIASKAIFNGVQQDTMDDRIHSPLLIGFPISDSVSYNGENKIQGQNDTFIQGTSYAYSGTGNGSVTEKRRLESDYLENGVYGNKISSIIDLLIHDPNMEDGEYRAVSVSSDVVIKCCNYVELLDSDGNTSYKIFTINEDGSVTSEETTTKPNQTKGSYTK